MRVWIAGDESADRAWLAERLAGAFDGIDVQELDGAAGLQRALSRAEADAPDLVVLSGAGDFAGQREVPLVWVVDAAEEASAADAMAQGLISDYVLRDHPARLVPAVRNALERAAMAARCATLEDQLARAASAGEASPVGAGSFLGALIETAPIGIAVVSGPDRRLELMNPACRAIHGFDEAEIVGRTLDEVFPEGLPLPEMEQWLDTVFATGEQLSVKARRFNILAEREDLYFDLDFVPLTDGDGGVARVLILTHDVTTEVVAKREMAAQHARLAAVLHNMPSGVVLIEAPTGRVVLSNAQVERIWGRSLDHIQDMGAYADYHGYHSDGRPVTPETWPVVRAMRTGEVITGEEITIERADGTNAIIRISAAPLHDETGQIVSAVAVFYDVTAQRKTEEALRKSELRYRRLFLNHRSPMLLIDPATGRIADANPAATAFYQYAGASLATMKITDLNVLPNAEVFGEMAEAVRDQGFFEFRHRLASGEIRDVEVFTSPVELDGQVLLHSIIHDVTERRRVQTELRQAHDQLDAVFRSIRDAVIIFDVRGTPVRANPGAQAILGYDPADGSSQPPPHVTIRWPDGRTTPRQDRPSRRALRGETVVDEELRVVDAEGRERWIVASAAPLQYEGRRMGAVLVWHDVSEQRTLTAQAQRRVAELDALFESIQAAVLLYNPDGSLARVNRRAVELLGYSNGEEGLPLAARVATLDMRTVEGEPFPADQLPAVRVLRGEPVASSLIKFRVPRESAAGAEERPSTWVMAHAGPIRGPEGQILGAAAVMMDVTAQQELLEQVEQQAAELRATMNAIADGVVVYGPAGEIIQMNDTARRILGYTDAVQEQPLSERVRLSRAETTSGVPYSARQVPAARALHGEIVRSEVLAIRQEGRRESLWLSASAAPIHTEDGRVLGAVATFSNVTELFAIQEALEQANAELEANAIELQEQAERLQEQNLELARLAKLAEAKEVRLQAILDALPLGVFIADEQGRIVEMNDRVYEIWGQEALRASSTKEYGAYQGWWADTGEPLEAEDWALARALHRGETSMAEVIDIERFDGTAGTILNSAAPIADRVGRITGAVAIIQDITTWRAVETALEERTRELEVLNRVSRQLVRTLLMDEVLGVVLQELCGLFEVSAAAAWLVDGEPATGGAEGGRGLLYRCVPGGPSGARVPVGLQRVPGGEGWLAQGYGMAGWVIAHGRSEAISDAPTNPHYAPEVDRHLGVQVQSVAAVPLKAQSKVIGVLEVYDKRVRAFDSQQLALAESIAVAAAMAVERAQLYEQARRDAEMRSVLLREVNHRVKNNLSAILGLISAERRRPGIREDDICRNVLDDLANRVFSLASAHTMLSAGGWADLMLASLVEQVAVSSLDVMEGDGLPEGDGARVEVAPSPVTVTAEQAHHLALLINELVTNTAKYGDGHGSARIGVEIEQQGDEIRLTFRDRGPGYPADVLRGEGRSVGLNLVDAIVRLSLRGRWDLYNDGGAVTEVRFPAHKEPNAEESDETKA